MAISEQAEWLKSHGGVVGHTPIPGTGSGVSTTLTTEKETREWEGWFPLLAGLAQKKTPKQGLEVQVNYLGDDPR